MLNFREELSKIKNKEVEKILKKILQYFHTRDLMSIEEGEKIQCSFAGNVIFVATHEDGELKKTIIIRHILKSPKIARLTIIFLEKKFIEEGFEIVDGSAREAGCFNVFIKA